MRGVRCTRRPLVWLGVLAVALLCSLTPTDTPPAAAQRAPVAPVAPVAYVAEALDHAADATGLSRRFLWCLALRESSYLPWAVGDYGAAHGLLQFHLATWNYYAPRYGFPGFSPYHAWASAHVAAGMIADRPRDWRWLYSQWPPARSCGSPWS